MAQKKMKMRRNPVRSFLLALIAAECGWMPGSSGVAAFVDLSAARPRLRLPPRQRTSPSRQRVATQTALPVLSASLPPGSLPVVTLKIAVDENGAVDDLGMKSKRFTSPASLDAVHRLRRDSDAVLVGVGTVIRDDPSLTVRRVEMPTGRAQPVRVVLDPSLRMPGSSTLLRDGHRTMVLCDSACPAPEHLQPDAKVEIVRVPRISNADGGSSRRGGSSMQGLASGRDLDLVEALKALRARGILHLMVEKTLDIKIESLKRHIGTNVNF